MAVRPDTTTKSAAPSTANTEEDLEQYGVWVKAEPQDIVEEPEDIPLDASDFDIPMGEPVQGEDSFLTEDEEKLLGSFEELDAAAEAAPKPLAESIEQFDMASSSIPDIENLPPLEDFEAKDESGSDVEELGAATIDISLDDLEPASPISPDTKIDIHAVRGLEPVPETFSFPSAPSAAAASSGIEDVSAEFLDFAESPGGSAGSDVTAEFLDGGPGGPSQDRQSEPEPDFEPIDMELHFDDTLNTEASGSSHGEPGFEAVSEFDDFLQEEDSPPGAKEPAFSPSRFDDVSAVERELSEPIPAPEAPRKSPAQAATAPAVSNDLLAKIANELSSIRNELVTLKGQIGALKAEELASPSAGETEQQKQKAAGGFFDEEEDETIALTGDELDNILNTADFTEESPGETEESLSVDLGSVDSDNESILPESGDYLTLNEAPAIEEIRLEPSTDTGHVPAEEETISDIDLMVDEGIQHLTQAPEDTSYLEEPLPDEEPLDLAEIPLHEESLVDDSKLDLGIDIEEMEPIAEISEELPLVEAAESGSSPETLADIALGLDATPDYLPGASAEVHGRETIPEFEDEGFADINLAEESLATESPDEVEELVSIEEDLSPFSMPESATDLAATIEEKTVKPAQPVSFHPDELPMSLDDSFFVGGDSHGAAEEAEELPEIEESVFKAPKAKAAPPPAAKEKAPSRDQDNDRLKSEIRGVLSYLDKLLESLPENKIDEFAHSEYFDTYKKLFEELGLV
jgi:hypothetical protein